MTEKKDSPGRSTRQPGEPFSTPSKLLPDPSRSIPVYPTEEVVRAGFHVGTRLPNGTIVTQIIEDKLSQRLAELLNRSMTAALAKWDLCPHVATSPIWAIPMTSHRIICEDCSRYDDSSWRHAPCNLCGDPEAMFVAHVLVGRLPGWPGQWTTWLLGNLCPECIRRETGLAVVL